MRVFPPILGLTGASKKLRSQVARAITQRFPELETRSFAQVVEAAYAEAHKRETASASKDQLKTFSQRQRDRFEDIWIHRVFTPPLAPEKRGALITDCKLPREFEALHYYQAFLIAVASADNEVLAYKAGNTEEEVFDGWTLRISLSHDTEASEDLLETVVFPAVQHYLET